MCPVTGHCCGVCVFDSVSLACFHSVSCVSCCVYLIVAFWVWRGTVLTTILRSTTVARPCSYTRTRSPLTSLCLLSHSDKDDEDIIAVKASRIISSWDTLSQNYRVSLSIAIWTHTMLLATLHKRTHPALTLASKAVFTYPRGMESWVVLGAFIMPWWRIKTATVWSKVRHPNCCPTMTLVLHVMLNILMMLCFWLTFVSCFTTLYIVPHCPPLPGYWVTPFTAQSTHTHHLKTLPPLFTLPPQCSPTLMHHYACQNLAQYKWLT